MKYVHIVRYNGPCENVTISVCSSENKAKRLVAIQPKPEQWEIIKVRLNAQFAE